MRRADKGRPVANKALVVENANCMGCLACEIACKQEHEVPVGTKLIKVLRDGPREIDGQIRMRYVVAQCVHCLQPSCRDACPAGAIRKRLDGTVLIDESLCTGCMNCVAACPFGAMDFDGAVGVAKKCDLCVARTDRGLAPSCASACPSRCISLREVDESAQAKRERHALSWVNLNR